MSVDNNRPTPLMLMEKFQQFLHLLKAYGYADVGASIVTIVLDDLLDQLTG